MYSCNQVVVKSPSDETTEKMKHVPRQTRRCAAPNEEINVNQIEKTNTKQEKPEGGISK